MLLTMRMLKTACSNDQHAGQASATFAAPCMALMVPGLLFHGFCK